MRISLALATLLVFSVAGMLIYKAHAQTKLGPLGEPTPAELKAMGAILVTVAPAKKPPLTRATAVANARMYLDQPKIKSTLSNKGQYLVTGYDLVQGNLKFVAIPGNRGGFLFLRSNQYKFTQHLAWEFQFNPIKKNLHPGQLVVDCVSIWVDAYCGEIIGESVTSISL